MSSITDIAAADSQHVTVKQESIESVSWHDDAWLLNGCHKHVAMILALPVASVCPLLPPHMLDSMIPSQMRQSDFEKARFSGMFIFSSSLSVPFKVAFSSDSQISLMLNDSSRAPEGSDAPEVWVVQTDTKFAAHHLDVGTPFKEVAHLLLQEFRRLLQKPLPACQA